jgi:choline dehydrogenase-like flavoprotein
MAEERGAEVYADCKVDRILIEKGRAIGVEATVRNIETDETVGSLRVKAKAVVLSAGTVGTPILLQRQSLANSSGQVGQNLALHPAVGTHGFVPEEINSWDGVPQAYAVFLDRKEGILLQTYNANPEIFFSSYPWSGLDGMKKIRRMRNLAMCGGLVCDRPSGAVTLGRRGQPVISYSLRDEERLKLIRAMRGTIRIMFAGGATEVHAGIGDDLKMYTREEDALAVLTDQVQERQMHVYASHPMGTCRMGVDKKKSVAAPDGQTHDVPGLYIADASLMPSSLGVNPQLTVMSLGILVGRSVAA